MKLSVRNDQNAVDLSLDRGTEYLIRSCGWKWVQWQTQVSFLFPHPKRVREDPCMDPNSTGLSKTHLCQVLHIGLNLLSSMCSPSSLLLLPSMAPMHLNLQTVIQKEPKAVLLCATVVMDLHPNHQEGKAEVPILEGCHSGLWQVVLGKSCWPENKTLPWIPCMSWKTRRCISNIPTYLPCSYVLAQAPTLVHSRR